MPGPQGCDFSPQWERSASVLGPLGQSQLQVASPSVALQGGGSACDKPQVALLGAALVQVHCWGGLSLRRAVVRVFWQTISSFTKAKMDSQDGGHHAYQ